MNDESGQNDSRRASTQQGTLGRMSAYPKTSALESGGEVGCEPNVVKHSTHSDDESSAPTRMTPLEDEIVIQSSRVQPISAQKEQESQPATNAEQQREAYYTVREKERHRGRLIITFDGFSRAHYLEQDVLTIGRGADNHVQVDDPKMSRHQLRIEPTLDSYKAIELSTRQSMRVRGRRVRSQELHHGTSIKVGDTEIRFESLGWIRRHRQGVLTHRLEIWSEVIANLSKADQSRLAIYAGSVSFLVAGFAFLLMSFVTQPRPPSLDEQSLAYRRQAEMRALSGDFQGALNSLDKVTFLMGELTPQDIQRREQWTSHLHDKSVAREIQVQTLADPLPEHLDQIAKGFSGEGSIKTDADTRIAQYKLHYLTLAVEKRRLSTNDRLRLEKIFREIEPSLVDSTQYAKVKTLLKL